MSEGGGVRGTSAKDMGRLTGWLIVPGKHCYRNAPKPLHREIDVVIALEIVDLCILL